MTVKGGEFSSPVELFSSKTVHLGQLGGDGGLE